MDQVKLDTVFILDDFGKALSNSFVSISSPYWKCFSLIVCQSLLKFLTLTTVLNIKYCILTCLTLVYMTVFFCLGILQTCCKAAAVGNLLLCLGSQLKYHSLCVLSNYYLAEDNTEIQIWGASVCWWGAVLTEVVYLVSLVKLFWLFKLVWHICTEPGLIVILLKGSL